MKLLTYLVKRNIKLYLRDKATVLFSLTSSLIIIALFVLFLGRLYVDNIVGLIADYNDVSSASVQALVFSWVLAGIIVLNAINIPGMILSRIILDKEQNVIGDFYVAPFKRSYLGLSYIISALIVGTVITYVSFIVGEVYIYAISGELFSLKVHLMIFIYTLLTTTSFSSMMFLIYLFVKTSSTIGGINALTSSVGGFLAGIYITIGNLTGITRDIVSSNPLAHATTLLRNVLMTDQIKLFISLSHAMFSSTNLKLYICNKV